jgi:hypothetical protein
MGSFTSDLSTKLLDHTFRSTAYTAPASLFISLLTGDPGEGGSTVDEVPTSGTGYVRQPVSFGPSTGAPPEIPNTADVSFPTATGVGFGTITHFALMDSVGAGVMLAHGQFTGGPKPVGAGDQLVIPLGGLVISLD